MGDLIVFQPGADLDREVSKRVGFVPWRVLGPNVPGEFPIYVDNWPEVSTDLNWAFRAAEACGLFIAGDFVDTGRVMLWYDQFSGWWCKVPEKEVGCGGRGDPTPAVAICRAICEHVDTPPRSTPMHVWELQVRAALESTKFTPPIEPPAEPPRV